MRILVGLTDLWPTEEDITVIPIVYPMEIYDQDEKPDYKTTITHDDQLRRWAYRHFEIHRMVDLDEEREFPT